MCFLGYLVCVWYVVDICVGGDYFGNGKLVCLFVCILNVFSVIVMSV